jgi:hypothetical protein
VRLDAPRTAMPLPLPLPLTTAAGRALVDHYHSSALPLLLPAVERGLFGINWRIRQSSIKLLGKLLFKVCGKA